MKKLMIALGAVALATGVQAAAVTWSSGTVYLPALATATTYQKAAASGTFKPYGSDTAVSKFATAYLFEFTTETLSTWQAYKDGTKDVWGSFNEETLTLGGQAYSKTGKTGGSGGVNLVGTTDYNGTDIGYGVIIYAWDKDSNGKADYYIAQVLDTKTATNPTGLVGSGVSVGNIAGTTSADVSAWQSVPEPTSGLLLLLGVAGLALRRRRA